MKKTVEDILFQHNNQPLYRILDRDSWGQLCHLSLNGDSRLDTADKMVDEGLRLGILEPE